MRPEDFIVAIASNTYLWTDQKGSVHYCYHQDDLIKSIRQIFHTERVKMAEIMRKGGGSAGPYCTCNLPDCEFKNPHSEDEDRILKAMTDAIKIDTHHSTEWILGTLRRVLSSMPSNKTNRIIDWILFQPWGLKIAKELSKIMINTWLTETNQRIAVVEAMERFWDWADEEEK